MASMTKLSPHALIYRNFVKSFCPNAFVIYCGDSYFRLFFGNGTKVVRGETRSAAWIAGFDLIARLS